MAGMAQRVRRYGATIFTEMTNLAQAHGAINLGQGFPDFPAPAFVKEAAQAAIAADINQYPPAIGRARLRTAVAATLARRHGLIVDPETQVTATHGATEAIFAAIQSLVDPGDEVIVFEPYFDSYTPSIEFAGGVPRFYTLRPPDWRIDPDALAALFTPRTKLILVNTPHNPTGKVWSAEELTLVADLCCRHDVIAVTDEVYEHIVFDEARHRPLATWPGMAERTVTISSIGKTFSVTGWKVGWVVSTPELTNAVFRSRQWITFAGAAPLEEAAGAALEWAERTDYYAQLRAAYQARRDRLMVALQAAGLTVFPPQGAFFVLADLSALGDGLNDDRAFCRYLTTQVGVAAIPPSVFYNTPGEGTTMARFAFCKSDATLDAAAERLAQLRPLPARRPN